MAALDLQAVLAALYQGPRGRPQSVVNPYRDEVPELDAAGAARRRRRNLEAYLEQVGRPRWILVGEALGFRGGRFSGIAFTSERQLAAEGARRLPWSRRPPFRATSRNPALWLEPSGSVVWGALGGRVRGILLWNAFPWHPHRPRLPLSNRLPETALLAANLHVLEALLAAAGKAGPARVLAVGRTAHLALARLGHSVPLLRHPAYGGAARFRGHLAAILAAGGAGGMSGPGRVPGVGGVGEMGR